MWETGHNQVPHLLPDQCRTVLVLGAGASAHLGFPLGHQLCSEIIQNTSDPDSSSFKDLLEMGFPHEKILSLHEQIRKSHSNAIDEFLSDRPEFIDVGRATIAQVLMGCENEDRLQNRDDNWYGVLRNRIKADIKNNRWRPIIVTFNYDLSLDKFLHDFVTSTFPMYAPIYHIFHVHGRLGCLDYEVSNTPGRSYGGGASPSDILAASRGIRVAAQLDTDYGRKMVLAQEAIKKAKCVIFLGFGYDDTNLDRLRVDNWEPGKFFGTAYGLDTARIHHLKALTKNGLSIGDPNCGISDYLPSLACWNVVGT